MVCWYIQVYILKLCCCMKQSQALCVCVCIWTSMIIGYYDVGQVSSV